MAREKLRRSDLDRVWSSLAGHPRLGSIAVAHRGARWAAGTTENGRARDAVEQIRTYSSGIRRASDRFEPYFIDGGIEDLDDAPEAIREGEGLPWHLPKAIVHWNWRNGGAWPITAVPDY